MSAPAHRSGTYHRQSERVRRAAYANPAMCCWRCGRTLQEHEPHRNGKPARWQAGHVTDGAIEGQLLPEASTCNTSAGGRLGSSIQSAARSIRRAVTPLTW